MTEFSIRQFHKGILARRVPTRSGQMEQRQIKDWEGSVKLDRMF
jgi:hypothetical protein